MLICACIVHLTAKAQSTAAPLTQSTNTPAPGYSSSLPAQAPGETSPAYTIETNLPAPVPAYLPEAMPAPRLAGTSQLSVPSAVSLPPVPPMLRWGPVSIQTFATYQLSYGDGLQAFPGKQSKSFVHEIDPGLLLQWGRHWILNYTPTFRFYSTRDLRNTFDNAVSLAGGASYEDWTFGLSQSYASYSDPIIETASQLNQQTFATGLSAIRQLGSQTSLQLGASQNFRFLDQIGAAQQLSDSRNWSTMDWFNYQFWSRLGAGVGIGFGYDNLAIGSDMTSEQFQGRVTWVVVKKLNFAISGGGEDRQFLRSGAPDLISPIFSMSAQYSPFAVTTFSISAFRTVTPSFYTDQVSQSTSISAGVHQRLLERFFLDLNGGYSTSTYHASTLGPAANVSNYDSTFFSARLGVTLLKRGSASVFYSANYNSSGSSLYNYTTTQVGFQLSYRY